MELKTFKQQKSELNKRMKEDKDRFEKFKLNRMKEILNMKRKNIEKDYEIRKLEKKKKKVMQYIMRKDEEAKRLKRANDTLKEILEPKNRNTFVKPMSRATVGGHANVEPTHV